MRILYSAVLSLFLVAAAEAATLAGVNLPDKTDVKGQSLVLNGIALRTKFFIKVYVAGLYVPQKRSPRPRSSPPTAAAASDALPLRRQQGADVRRLERRPGGEHSGRPGRGEEGVHDALQLDGADREGQGAGAHLRPRGGHPGRDQRKLKGTLTGKPTADAVLSTWLGAKPDPGEDFKKALLGG